MGKYKFHHKFRFLHMFSLSMAAGCAVAAAPLLTMAYTVQQGDTLTSICDGDYERALRIAELNGIENPDVISVGDEIDLFEEEESLLVNEDDVKSDSESENHEKDTEENVNASIAEEAAKYLGTKYVWGGSAPGGFDCSGFVSWAVNHSDCGTDVGRSTAEGLRQYCTEISKDVLEVGDLIFFQGTYNTSGASHVGIYVGDGQMIHCSTKNGVCYTSIEKSYWINHYMSCGRINT